MIVNAARSLPSVSNPTPNAQQLEYSLITDLIFWNKQIDKERQQNHTRLINLQFRHQPIQKDIYKNNFGNGTKGKRFRLSMSMTLVQINLYNDRKQLVAVAVKLSLFSMYSARLLF